MNKKYLLSNQKKLFIIWTRGSLKFFLGMHSAYGALI
jgi:hypothetical protein